MDKLSVKEGNVYGKLTVTKVEKSFFKGYNQTYAKCLCECGVSKDFELSQLYKNIKQDCGCTYKNSIKDRQNKKIESVINKKFNKITITSAFHNDSRLYVTYKCDCGTKVLKPTFFQDIQANKIKSCGCLSKQLSSINRQRSEEDIKNLIGNQNNDLTILNAYYDNIDLSNSLAVKVICKCGQTKTMTYENFKKVRSCGCRSSEREFIYNTDFFKTLTCESAYTLGLIYTDGCLQKNSNSCIITLQEEDKHILEKIGVKIRNTTKVRFEVRAKPNHKDKNTLTIQNKELYQDLLSWNLTPAKSKTLTVDERLKFNSHFWRGAFDGDGCIYLEPNKKNTDYTLTISICGTIDICENFKNWCNTTGSISKSNVRLLPNRDNFAVYFVKGKNAEIIMEKLYENCNDFKLDRKFNKFQEYKKNKIYRIIKNDSKNI